VRKPPDDVVQSVLLDLRQRRVEFEGKGRTRRRPGGERPAIPFVWQGLFAGVIRVTDRRRSSPSSSRGCGSGNAIAIAIVTAGFVGSVMVLGIGLRMAGLLVREDDDGRCVVGGCRRHVHVRRRGTSSGDPQSSRRRRARASGVPLFRTVVAASSW